MDNPIQISSGTLSAAIHPLGAELWSLTDSAGREFMTDADPAYWTGHAPLLFPIVGALQSGRYRLGDKVFEMAQHGVARRQSFALVEQASDRIRFRLRDNEATRALYPFAFTLDAAYSLEGSTLTMSISATNAGDVDMPASFGFHPAFAWPLPFGAPRADHVIALVADEPDALCLLDGGVIVSEDRPSPLADGRTLALADDLFGQDALIWRTARSRACRYGPADGPALEIAWSDMPSLGIWTKPGAHYICIEPWDGHADLAGFTGELRDKPGIRIIAPGESLDWWMRVTVPSA